VLPLVAVTPQHAATARQKKQKQTDAGRWKRAGVRNPFKKLMATSVHTQRHTPHTTRRAFASSIRVCFCLIFYLPIVSAVLSSSRLLFYCYCYITTPHSLLYKNSNDVSCLLPLALASRKLPVVCATVFFCGAYLLRPNCALLARTYKIKTTHFHSKHTTLNKRHTRRQK